MLWHNHAAPCSSDLENNNLGATFFQSSNLNAFHDSSARDPPPRCHPGTRLYERESLSRWAADGGVRLLWMTGLAGVGKSAIAQTVAETLDLEGRLGAAFFFSRLNDSDPAHQLFPSIAYRLFKSNATYAAALEKEIRHNPRLLAGSLHQQFISSIVHPSRGVPELQKNPMTILIDGLDECAGIEAQTEIARIIASSVGEETTPFTWIITSRPEPHLRSVLSSPKTSSCCRTVVISDSHEDVKRFLIDKLRTMGRRMTIPSSAGWLSMENVNSIANISHGRFLIAAMAVAVIDDTSDDPQRVLDNILMRLEEHKIDAASGDSNLLRLHYLFSYILEQMPKDGLAILHEVVLASTIPGIHSNAAAIANLLHLSESQLRECLGSSHPLAAIVSTFTGPQVRLYHASFLDYLEDSARATTYMGPAHVVSLRNKLFQRIAEMQNLRHLTPASIDPLLITWRHDGRNYLDQYRAYSNTLTALFELCQLAPLDDYALDALSQIDFSALCLFWNYIEVQTNMEGLLRAIPTQLQTSIIRHYTKSASAVDHSLPPSGADPNFSFILGSGRRQAFCWGKDGCKRFQITPYLRFQLLRYLRRCGTHWVLIQSYWLT